MARSDRGGTNSPVETSCLPDDGVNSIQIRYLHRCRGNRQAQRDLGGDVLAGYLIHYVALV